MNTSNFSRKLQNINIWGVPKFRLYRTEGTSKKDLLFVSTSVKRLLTKWNIRGFSWYDLKYFVLSLF